MVQPYFVEFGGERFDIADTRHDYERFPLDDYLPILRAFVADTAESCSYHRQRLDRAGVSPAEIQSIDDFRRIPLMWPDDVSSVPDLRLLPDRYVEALKTGSWAGFEPPRRLCRKFMSGGSTGKQPKSSYYTAVDWDASCASVRRNLAHLDIHEYSRMYNAFHPGHFGGKSTEDVFTRAGCLVENSHHTNKDVDSVLRQMYRGLATVGGFNALAVPTWRPPELRGNKGTTLIELLDADVDNYIGRNIRLVSVGAAPMPKEERLFERVWEANELAGSPKAIVLDKYGSAEVGIATATCQAHSGMHVYQGYIYTEVINPENGAHVENGERGLVVFTSLKHGSRYLRYVQGDEATYVDEKCECGRVSGRLLDVQRIMDMERVTSGCSAGGL